MKQVPWGCYSHQDPPHTPPYPRCLQCPVSCHHIGHSPPLSPSPPLRSNAFHYRSQQTNVALNMAKVFLFPADNNVNLSASSNACVPHYVSILAHSILRPYLLHLNSKNPAFTSVLTVKWSMIHTHTLLQERCQLSGILLPSVCLEAAHSKTNLFTIVFNFYHVQCVLQPLLLLSTYVSAEKYLHMYVLQLFNSLRIPQQLIFLSN